MDNIGQLYDDDAFGHKPFAQRIADGIINYQTRNTKGMVIGLYGPWGAGKSDVLHYVATHLKGKMFVNTCKVMRFSPWEFAGRRHLSQVFLEQLRATVAQESRFAGLPKLLVNFADSMRDVEMPGVWGLGMFILQLVTQRWRTPHDVMQLKEKIGNILDKEKMSIVVLIDDMDRLELDELHQMLGVIKAMSDIKKVIFLLAIDNESTESMMAQKTTNGDAYSLEKIIDVALTLPAFDRFALENALNRRLAEMIVKYQQDTCQNDTIVAGMRNQHKVIDAEYWAIIFTHVATLIQQPRDVVRFCDALSITYASQHEKVYVVDFIAVEALRFFVPQLYDFLRLHPEQCVGNLPVIDVHQQNEFLASCAAKIVNMGQNEHVVDTRRIAVLLVLRKLFPRLDRRQLSDSEWQKHTEMQRVCISPDLFARYFRYDVSRGDNRRSDIMALVRNVTSEDVLAARLRKMTSETEEYHKRIPAMIERLHDHVETDILPAQVPMYVRVVLDIGDELVTEQLSYVYVVSDDWRVAKLVVRLLMILPVAERTALLHDSIVAGSAKGIQARVISFCSDAIDQNPDNDDGKVIIPPESVARCKQQWVEGITMHGGISHYLKNKMLYKLIMDSYNTWSRT